MKRQHRSYPNRTLAHAHPVARAIAKKRIRAHMTDIGVHVFLAEHGADETALLAHLGWMIGLGAETALHALGDGPTLRRLHGAARQIQALCLAGYHWDAEQAEPLYQAAKLGVEVLIEHDAIAAHYMPGADTFAERIRNHLVDASDITGAEVYRDERKSA